MSDRDNFDRPTSPLQKFTGRARSNTFSTGKLVQGLFRRPSTTSIKILGNIATSNIVRSSPRLSCGEAPPRNSLDTIHEKSPPTYDSRALSPPPVSPSTSRSPPTLPDQSLELSPLHKSLEISRLSMASQSSNGSNYQSFIDLTNPESPVQEAQAPAPAPAPAPLSSGAKEAARLTKPPPSSFLSFPIPKPPRAPPSPAEDLEDNPRISAGHRLRSLFLYRTRSRDLDHQLNTSFPSPPFSGYSPTTDDESSDRHPYATSAPVTPSTPPPTPPSRFSELPPIMPSVNVVKTVTKSFDASIYEAEIVWEYPPPRDLEVRCYEESDNIELKVAIQRLRLLR